MKIKFLGPAKMIGDVTYFAPPWWKVWQRKMRKRIIAEATYQATELAAGRDPYPDLEWHRTEDDPPPWMR
jgi:hypothetical protein